MSCKLCPVKIEWAHIAEIGKACPSCRKQYVQMLAGFKGILPTTKEEKELWDNSEAYNEWVGKLEATDADHHISIRSKDEYVKQRIDVREMRNVVGLPPFESLEKQVFTAWIEEGVKDERMQEVLGLTYRQLTHVKSVVRARLRKQMAFYHQVQKLEAQAEQIKKQKGF